MLNLKAVACGVAVGALALSTFAQPASGGKGGGKDSKQPGAKAPEGGQPRGEGRGQGGMRMEPLSPEKAKAAWDLEATGVATRLKLTADQTKSLVSAYESARTSQQAAMEKARKEAQDSGDRQGA